MCFNEYISALYHIFMEELPVGQQIPSEILNIILYRYGGLANTKMIDCFNEFRSKTFNVRPANHTFNYPGDTYLNPSFRISVNTHKLDINKYMSSKMIHTLMLSKIFMTRMKNDISDKIFTIKFQGTTHYETKTISRYLNVCNSRKRYLLSSPVNNGRKISLITKLMLNPRLNYLFSEQFLEKEISQELNIDIDKVGYHKLHRADLINLYIGYGYNFSWFDCIQN